MTTRFPEEQPRDSESLEKVPDRPRAYHGRADLPPDPEDLWLDALIRALRTPREERLKDPAVAAIVRKFRPDLLPPDLPPPK